MPVTEGRRIVAFYEGSSSDDEGRMLVDVLRFSDAHLEYIHDFIQWLFPLRERSGANPSAPCLDDEAIAQFRERKELRDNMARALGRMLEFYGLAREGDAIVPTPAFSQHAGWLTPGNHNHLRLTRMLKSLRLLGNEQLARALFERLRIIYNEQQRKGRPAINDLTFRYWEDAVRK